MSTTILHKGTIQKCLDETTLEQAYEIRVLQQENFKDIHQLEIETSQELGKGTYTPGEVDDIRSMLDGDLSIGAFIDSDLIAFRLIRFPFSKPHEVLKRFNIPQKEYQLIADLDGIIVSTGYKKQGLATRLTTLALQRLKERGCKHTFATISPGNTPSLRYLFSLGFIAVDINNIYGTGPRLLMYRDIS